MNTSFCGVREKVDPRVVVEWFCEFTDFGAEHEQVNDGTRKNVIQNEIIQTQKEKT